MIESDKENRSLDAISAASHPFQSAFFIPMIEGLEVLDTTNPLAGQITPEPRMQVITISYPTMPPDVVIDRPFPFTAYIEYADNGRDDKSTIISGTGSAGRSWNIDFGDEIQGGELRYDCVIKFRHIPTGQTGDVTYHATKGSIRGINPSPAAVRSYIGTLELQVIAYKESRFRQFDKGLPKFGPPRGFGVMQLDTPPPDRRQLWDWKQNVDGGKALFETKKAEIAHHFNKIRKENPSAPDLTDEMLTLALYQYYNGGVYWAYDATSNTWVKNDTTGYADDLLKILKLVQAGTPPKDWDSQTMIS